ncbi:hypothetical protein A11A3_09405 [Alcanivorax hongdengensis A-11-3]|uniref:Replication initiation factor n=1 Tax=Alcanivorax hongdengensis A-11-3 TaxID=1177179 RepID=L0WEG5_9GAMM|nr:hypothetical protein [Alcanivorax hongdengensis]EKF74205.1 hypothetical protein A11A3_09405 [Alcanivorax hongdengensis A-11-3]
MAKAPTHCLSFDEDMTESPFGRIFIDSGTADVFNLSDVNVVHFGVDTVRQLYRGRLRPELLALFAEPGLVDFAGERWHAGRVGRDSGYQFKLQNADLGLILLIKSFHASNDAIAHHLKVEVSPHCIRSESPYGLQQLMNRFADAVLLSAEPAQSAVHIAVDLQGWAPPRDFEGHVHCRSRRSQSYSGIDSVDFDTTSAVYGRGETFTFGSVSAVQLSVYNKSLEAKCRDKLDFWRSVWADSGRYDYDQPVTRVELRFHHSVVQQFADGSINQETGEVIASTDYFGLHAHLDGLWQYGLHAFKYLHRPGVYHPVWTLLGNQLLSDDNEPVEYKRYYKSASGFSGKNVELLLGNYISCAARHRMSSAQAYKALERLPFFDLLIEHYRDKGMKTWEFKQHFRDLLEERYIRYGRAV